VSSSVRNDRSWPDIQYTLNSFGLFGGIDEMLARIFNVKPGAYTKYLGRYLIEEKDANFVAVALLRPKSFGEIRLASRDPFVSPIIQPNYFSHPDDMRAMVDGKLPIQLAQFAFIWKSWKTSQLPQYLFYRCEAAS
jgi:choline dehydrogenase-like flavoprotein